MNENKAYQVKLKFEEVKEQQKRMNNLTKEEIFSLQLGEQLDIAAHEPKYKKQMLVEDLKEYINLKHSARLTKQLYDKIMKFKSGTLVMVTQEIYKGVIIFEVEEITEEYIQNII